MDYGLYRYDEPYARPVRRRINYFAWTVAILLLTGFAFAAWLGSFYIFSQPERPDSYRILQKLHKIEPPKRFELTAAPPGEFLSAKQLYDRYNAMGSAELTKTNAELTRNYIRNFQQVRGLVPYVVGRYVIMEARELSSSDIFTSGMVALTGSVESPELLMEHLYPAEPQAVPLIKQTLSTGLELKLDRAHDLSALIHVERFPDGRIMLSSVPLLYGTYTVMRGTGTFSLEPPLSLNLEGGWPLFKEQARLRGEMHYAQFRQGTPRAQTPAQVAIPGFAPSGTPPPAENQPRKASWLKANRLRNLRLQQLLLSSPKNRHLPQRRHHRLLKHRRRHHRRKVPLQRRPQKRRSPHRRSRSLNRLKLQCAPNPLSPLLPTWARWRQPLAAEVGKLFRRGKCHSGVSLPRAILRKSPITEQRANEFI
jgi:hypothetical protein